jgi:hypothetical protein
LYSFSALVAVWTRSTAACVVATLAFWALCSGFNEAHLASPGRPAVEVGYWLLPKPGDCVVLLGEVLHAGNHFRFTGAGAPTAVHAELSVISSLLFIAALLALAGRRFVRQDY